MPADAALEFPTTYGEQATTVTLDGKSHLWQAAIAALSIVRVQPFCSVSSVEKNDDPVQAERIVLKRTAL